MEPEFLSLDEILEIHAEQIERYGGSLGLRDAALLDSAIATPQATFNCAYLHTSIPAMAAAYLFHLCQNIRLSMATSGSEQMRRLPFC